MSLRSNRQKETASVETGIFCTAGSSITPIKISATGKTVSSARRHSFGEQDCDTLGPKITKGKDFL